MKDMEITKEKDRLIISISDVGRIDSADDVKHVLVNVVFKNASVPEGYDIGSFSNIPPFPEELTSKQRCVLLAGSHLAPIIKTLSQIFGLPIEDLVDSIIPALKASS